MREPGSRDGDAAVLHWRGLVAQMDQAAAAGRVEREADGQPCDWVLDDWNPAFEELFELDRVAGTVVELRASDHAELRLGVLPVIADVLVTGRGARVERRTRAGGRVRLSIFKTNVDRFGVVGTPFAPPSDADRRDWARARSLLRARQRGEPAKRSGMTLHQVFGSAENLLSVVLDRFPVGVLVAEAPSGRIVYANEHVPTIHPEDVPLVTCAEDYGARPGFHADGRAYTWDEWPLARTVRHGVTVREEDVFVDGADGTRRVIRISSAPVRDGSGRVIAGLATTFDVTAQRALEAAHESLPAYRDELEESRARLSLALGSANLGWWDRDLRTGSLLWDDKFKGMLGLPSDTEPSVDRLRALVHPDDWVRLDYEMKRCLDPAGTGAHDFTYRVVRQDGRVRWLHSRGRVLFEDGPDGRAAVRFSGTAMDVTHQKEVEERLVLNENRLNLAMENAGVGLWDWDLNTGALTWDARLRRIFGVPAAEPVDIDLMFSRVAEQDRDTLQDAMAGALDPGGDGSYDAEFRVRPTPTEVRWVAAKGRVLFEGRAAARHAVRFTGTAQDITDRKRAEEDLRHERLFLRQVLDADPSVVLVKDDEGRFVLANEAAARYFGVPLPDLVGRAEHDVAFVASLEQLAEVQRQDREVLRTGVGMRLQERLPAADGRQHWFNLAKVPIFDESGAVRRMLIVASDITEQKEAEDRLRRHETLLAESQRIAHLGSFTLDADTGHLWLSDEARRIYRFAPGEPVTLDAIYARLEPEDAVMARASLEASRGGAGPDIVRYRIIDGDGAVRVIERRCHLERSGGRETLVGTIQDVTTHVDAENRRLELELRVQKAEKLESLSVLAGGVAHDFNNLLTGVIGNADLCLMQLDEESPLRDLLENVKIAGLRASELSGQMLAYSGRGRFAVTNVDVSALARDMLRLLRATVSKRMDLRPLLEAGMPPVQADAAQLRQVLLNLVTNAAEAIGDRDGIIEIRTRRETVDPLDARAGADGDPLAPGEYVVLEVVDDGPGMDEATRARVFEPFFSTKFTGRGLGLAAVMGIVRSHHGSIEALSRPGEGTTFRVLLPATSVRAAVRHAPRTQVAAPATDGPLVLVVDDEDAVRTTVRGVLEHHGYRVLDAPDGPEGVRLFREHAADVRAVLLDWTMPSMDGGEALRALRGIRDDVPVIVASGHDESDLASRVGEIGRAHVLAKPFDGSTLVNSVRTAMRED